MLQLVNFNDHPQSPHHTIFSFKNPQQADFFEENLKNNNLFFERHNDIEDNEEVFYFAVKRIDFEKVKQINFLCLGKYRKPFISDPALRWFVLSIFFILMGLLISGMVVTSING
jgi:hypothetical protein